MPKRVGQQLREARTQRGVELSEVERVTKIRVKFLRAIEEGRWEDLPAPVYARGFLSTYARYLGLEEKPLLERYRKESGDMEQPAPVPYGAVRRGELSGGGGHPRRRPGVLPVALLTLLVIGLAIAVALGGEGDDGGGPSQERTPVARNQPKPDSPATTTAPSGTTTSEPSTPGAEVSLDLSAADDVWVCVVDAEGSHVVNGETLSTDQSRGPFSSSRFEMTFGNGSVEMTVDGESVRVPALAEPLGYRVTSAGAKRLDSSAQPSCA
jgi:cytoskeletal protein RodZ